MPFTDSIKLVDVIITDKETLDATHNDVIAGKKFIGATQIILTDEFAGLCLLYEATHGEEDKKSMPNPRDEERFLKDFNDLVKN